ncbi:MAG TPA: GNAT family N-acetyltransferase [Fibrobacteria bacterium]|nr:GNAT family N-acetyltransferase [Fibrobacteria bacterium]
MQISHVKYFQNWIPIIAKWIYEEWAYAFPLRTLMDIQKTLFGRMNENEMPITLIAHDERGVLGTASLKASDMEILPELTPWLSSVFVHPDHRGEGVATALVAEIEKIARQQGFSRLYVFNPISQGVFEKLGWSVLQTVQYGGKELAILFKDIGTAA